MMHPKRVDEAVHDLWRVLEARHAQRRPQQHVSQPSRVRSNSCPPLRLPEDFLHPEFGKADMLAQPGGFRRHFMQPVHFSRPGHEPVESLAEVIEKEPTVARRWRRTGMAAWSSRQRWLFRFVMCVTAINFSNQTVMTSFLPLVLHGTRGYSLGTIGLLSATFSCAALVFTQPSVRLTTATKQIIILHSCSLLIMAAFTLSFGAAYFLPEHFSASCLFLARFGQGGASALYFAATISIVTRNFPDDIPQVVGIVETCMSVGSMAGRIIGGTIYDLLGFMGPFVLEAVTLMLLGVLGLAFVTTLDQKQGGLSEPLIRSTEGEDEPTKPDIIREASGIPPRSRRIIALATIGTVLSWLPCGFYDASLAIHLNYFLGPLSSTRLGLLLSITPFVYTFSSMVLAAIIRQELLLRLMLFGAGLCSSGLLLLGPAEPLRPLLPEHSVRGGVGQAVALAVAAVGMSMLSIPALPLMQNAVSSSGPFVIESVSKYCIAGMNLGQGLGPVLGGAAMQVLGFSATASIGAVFFVAWAAIGPPCVAERAEDEASCYQTPTGELSCVPMSLEPNYAAQWSPVVQAAQRSVFRRSASL